MKDFCIILMFDRKFVKKSHTTIKQIREVGLYDGDIVCILSDDLKNHTNLLYKGENIIYKHFKEIDRSKIVKPLTNEMKICFPMWAKMIHYHKFYCFHTWFRDNYKKCFYIDTGTQIFKSLSKMIDIECDGKFLAHSNAYPDYEDTLTCQFDNVVYPELYKELQINYDLNVDHFQATVMLFDTKIIQDNSFDLLWLLANKYVNCKTNDQGILNLYFNATLHIWKQLKIGDEETYYYDFWERGDLTKKDYIMLKYPKT